MGQCALASEPGAVCILHRAVGGTLLHEEREVERAHGDGHRKHSQNAGPYCPFAVASHGTDLP
jgi:hypothetical protein